MNRRAGVLAAHSLDHVDFRCLAGKPLGEPIAWRGPIVMNSQEQLRTAFEELASGTFTKHPHPPRAPER